MLQEAFPKETKSIKLIEKCIREFAAVDPTSESFRYSRSKRGGRSLEGITHINLRRIHDVMQDVSGLLDGASILFAEYR